MPAASALTRLLPTAVGGAVASCGTYLLTLAWPEAWGGPLRSALATTVIGCLCAGIAFGAPVSRWVIRGLLIGVAAGCTGLSLLVLPGVMETTAWRGVWYLAVTAIAAVMATTAGAALGSLFPGSHHTRLPTGRRRRSAAARTQPVPQRPVSRVTPPSRNTGNVSGVDPDADTVPLWRVRPVPRHRGAR